MGDARRLTDDQARAIVGRILAASGIARSDPADIEFALIVHRERLTARDVKRRPEYAAMLIDNGEADLKDLWYLAFGPALSALAIMRQFNHAIDAGITSFRFFASNMAAGPCLAAAALSDRVIKWDKVAIPPLADCDRPDQCACRWRSELTWDDD